MSKQLDTRICQKCDTTQNWNLVEESFIPLDGEIIVYTNTIVDEQEILSDKGLSIPRIKIGDGETTLINLPFISGVPKEDPSVPVEKIKVKKPSLQTNYFEYSYNTQREVFLVDFDESIMSYVVNSIFKASDAGEYTIGVQLIDTNNYCWEDETTTTVELKWRITKSTPELHVYIDPEMNTPLPVDQSWTLTLSDSIVLYARCDVEGVETMWSLSFDNNIVSAIVENHTEDMSKKISIRPLATTDETYVIITVPGNDNYEAVGVTISNIKITSDISGILNENSWETIDHVASKGQAQTYWEVGELKRVDIPANISIGNYFTTTQTIECFACILGFNHDSTNNTIDFGLPCLGHLKPTTEYTIDKLYAFIDSKYRETVPENTVGFSIGTKDHANIYEGSLDCYIPNCYSNKSDSNMNKCFEDIIENIFEVNYLNSNLLQPMTVKTPALISIRYDYDQSMVRLFYRSDFAVFHNQKLKLPSVTEFGKSYTVRDIDAPRISNDATDYISSDCDIDADTKLDNGTITTTYAYYNSANYYDKEIKELSNDGTYSNNLAQYWYRDVYLSKNINTDETLNSAYSGTLVYNSERDLVESSYVYNSNGIVVIFRLGGKDINE